MEVITTETWKDLTSRKTKTKLSAKSRNYNNHEKHSVRDLVNQHMQQLHKDNLIAEELT